MKKELSIVEYMNHDVVMKNIQDTLRDRSHQFIASVASLVNGSPALAQCDKKSLLSACLTSAAVNLPFTPGLGLAFIIPYDMSIKSKEEKNGKQLVVTKTVKLAQFQIGWKGIVQLALRTKRYKHINVTDVRESEYKGKNRLTGEDMFDWINDEVKRDQEGIIGYLAYFELTEGFSKTNYMTVDKVRVHAQKYSKAFRAGFGNWKDDFDSMARKTVLKNLIQKFGPMNQELETAILSDQAVVEEGTNQYVDNRREDPSEVAQEKERTRIIKHIEKSQSLEELELCEEAVHEFPGEELVAVYSAKKSELTKEVK